MADSTLWQWLGGLAFATVAALFGHAHHRIGRENDAVWRKLDEHEQLFREVVTKDDLVASNRDLKEYIRDLLSRSREFR